MEADDFKHIAVRLSFASNDHLIALIDEMAKDDKPKTTSYSNDALHRMVISGGSPDLIVLGAVEALQHVERLVLMETSYRWRRLLTAMQEDI